MGTAWETATDNSSALFDSQFECLMDRCPEETCPSCVGPNADNFLTMIDPESYFEEYNSLGVYGVPAYYADLMTCAKTECLEFKPCSDCQSNFDTAFKIRYSNSDDCSKNQCNKCANCEEKFNTHFTTRYPNATVCAEDHCAKWTCSYCDVTLDTFMGEDALDYPFWINDKGPAGPDMILEYYDYGKFDTQATCKDFICANCTDCIEGYQSSFRTEYPDAETCRAFECPQVCSRCKYEWATMLDPMTKTLFTGIDDCMQEHCHLLLASSCGRSDGRTGFLQRRYDLIDENEDQWDMSEISYIDSDDLPKADYLQCFEDLGGIRSVRYYGNTSDPMMDTQGEFFECSWCDLAQTFFDIFDARDVVPRTCEDHFCRTKDAPRAGPGGARGSRPTVQDPTDDPIDSCTTGLGEGNAYLRQSFEADTICESFYTYYTECERVFFTQQISRGEAYLKLDVDILCGSCQACNYNWN